MAHSGSLEMATKKKAVEQAVLCLNRRLSDFHAHGTLKELHGHVMDIVLTLEKDCGTFFSWDRFGSFHPDGKCINSSVELSVRAYYAARVRQLAEGDGCLLCGRDANRPLVCWQSGEPEVLSVLPLDEEYELLDSTALNEPQQWALSVLTGLNTLFYCEELVSDSGRAVARLSRLNWFLHPMLSQPMTWEYVDMMHRHLRDTGSFKPCRRRGRKF